MFNNITVQPDAQRRVRTVHRGHTGVGVQRCISGPKRRRFQRRMHNSRDHSLVGMDARETDCAAVSIIRRWGVMEALLGYRAS